MFSNSKISFYNWVVIGLMALTFIVIGKVITTRYRIAGISDVFQMA